MGSGPKDCEVDGESGVGDGVRLPIASTPLGATPPGSAERKPSEIPSETRSVSVFLLGRASVGPRSSGKVALGSLTPPCPV